MSEFHGRNRWNEHLSETQLERRRKKAYYRELASIATGGDRKTTKKVAWQLEQEDRKPEKQATFRGMSDEELDKFVDDLMKGKID